LGAVPTNDSTASFIALERGAAMRTRTDVMMNQAKTKSALLIAGPTASGKSALALQLARERGGVIINADALQVYRELRILTARPSDAELMEAPHSLYGHVSGTAAYSVAAWLADAKAEIAKAWAEGLLPIVTGGTGLYFMALEQGLAEVPVIDPAIREKWRSFEGDIHVELQRRDPLAAVKLKPNDRQRIARALEVIEGTGKPLTHWQGEAQSQAFLHDVVVERLMVEVPREALYARADARFDRMIAAGALKEVKLLLGLDSSLPVMRAIGVPELTRHLRKEIGLEEAVALAKIATRQYIKRQLTWGRGQAKGWSTA
jgi:tRNA dimethylallyltransferase